MSARGRAHAIQQFKHFYKEREQRRSIAFQHQDNAVAAAVAVVVVVLVNLNLRTIH